MRWILHDETGAVRSDIEEYELFHLLLVNSEEGNPVYVMSEDGTRRVSLQVQMFEVEPEPVVDPESEPVSE